MNIVILTGRATTDIELNTTTNGTSVATFSLAVDRNYTAKGQERQTDFIKCVAWRNTAEFVSKWFRKGSAMLVKGELQARKFEDKDGNKRTSFEVVIDTAQFFESKRNESQPDVQHPTGNDGAFSAMDDYDGDLPF